MTEQSTVQTPPGGVMTDEVGAITGEVIIGTEEQPGGVSVTAAYVGADDLYTVTGSPLPAGTPHADILTKLTQDPGLDGDDNPRTVDLTGW